MSEEESQFKVTDRRLFNPDGSPRDYEREETPEPAPSPVSATPTNSSSEPAIPASAQTTGIEPPSEPVHDDDEPVDLNDHDDIPGADEPTSFINFLMSIASNAASALGMMEHPVTKERGVDLQLGKHWIDILGMLQDKTRGNLHPQEEKIFTGILADLRMQFVSLSKTPPRTQPASGFTGKDIIGGN